ncbi:uncharacterized protein LOC118187570 isoform X2 [Stegodyphus dumicola]|uniref:uncharacterized protein LOC118187570 isoform X2 n=1 Tax=Stegodyphus dumicola TaxID=202533 RepID=UPI0015AEA4B4|nr:uncharacterized protein LOC118187570 isoform X2 [Stegodyphus dumicola]
MARYESKAISYYLVLFCMFRFVLICFTGDKLGTEAISLVSKVCQAQVYGLPHNTQFQVKLLVSQTAVKPSSATACQFFTLSRPFFLTIVGTTFTCLVVFLQVKTDPAKFATAGNDTSLSGC